MAQSLTAELAAGHAREQALWDRVIAESTARAEGQLEAAQAQLAELKAAQGRPFWRRIFGGQRVAPPQPAPIARVHGAYWPHWYFWSIGPTGIFGLLTPLVISVY